MLNYSRSVLNRGVYFILGNQSIFAIMIRRDIIILIVLLHKICLCFTQNLAHFLAFKYLKLYIRGEKNIFPSCLIISVIYS